MSDSQATRWVGWRRQFNSSMAWQKVPESEADTRGRCYDLLMDESELKRVAGELVHYEYHILPVGETPPHTIQAYSDRMMRKRN